MQHLYQVSLETYDTIPNAFKELKSIVMGENVLFIIFLLTSLPRVKLAAAMFAMPVSLLDKNLAG